MNSSPDTLATARETALELYERCLAAQSPIFLESFIEQCLAQTPPPLDLLYELADDIQQRLLALREYHFDVRKNVIDALYRVYHTNIAHLSPIDQPQSYHLLNPKNVLATVRQQGFLLSDEETRILVEMVKTSSSISAQLYRDIQLTEQVYAMLDDWLFAYLMANLRTDHDSSSIPVQ